MWLWLWNSGDLGRALLLPVLVPLQPPSGQSGVGATSSSADHSANKPVAAWGHLQQTWVLVYPGYPRACRVGGEGQLPGSEASLQKESGSPLAWLTSS